MDEPPHAETSKKPTTRIKGKKERQGLLISPSFSGREIAGSHLIRRISGRSYTLSKDRLQNYYQSGDLTLDG